MEQCVTAAIIALKYKARVEVTDCDKRPILLIITISSFIIQAQGTTKLITSLIMST